MLGGDTAEGGEGEASEASVTGTPVGVAVTAGVTGAAVTAGLDDTPGEAVKTAGLGMVPPAGVNGVPALGEGVVRGKAAARGKGSDCRDGGGICDDLGDGVAAGVPEVTGSGGGGGEKRVLGGEA